MSGSEDRGSNRLPFLTTADPMSCEEEPSDTERFEESEDDAEWGDRTQTVFLRPPPSLSLPPSGGLFGNERVLSPRGSRKQRAISRTRSLHRSSEAINFCPQADKPQTLKRTQSPNAPLLVPIKRSRSVQSARRHARTEAPAEPLSARRQLFSPRIRCDPPGSHAPARTTTPPATPSPPSAFPSVPTPISLQSISQPLFFGSVSAPEIPLPDPLDEENVPQCNGVRRPRSGAISLTPSASVRRSVSDLTVKSTPQPNGLSMSCSHLPLPPRMGDIHDTVYPPIVPVLPKTNRYQEISGSTLVDLMEFHFENQFERVLIIDCRSKVEFDGGHIRGALSMVPSELNDTLLEMFMRNPVVRRNWAIIFHCEYSAVRGPHGWETLRSMDRKAIGIDKYPHCYYPYMYVLQGGYRQFYKDWPEHCDGGYLPMSGKDKTCDKLLNSRR